MTTLPLAAYRLLLTLVEPAAPLLLRRRAGRGKEDPSRLSERLGRSRRERPQGPLVWMHGASVGETLSLLPLIDRLRAERPDVNLLVTSGTATSADLMARRLPFDVPHQYAPVDAPRAVARFLGHWRPDIALFVEGEIWPNLLLGAKLRGAKLALVSARITESTAAGWRRFPKSAAMLFGAFDLTLAQDEASATRLKGLGAHVQGRLNLKLAGKPLPADPVAVAAIRAEAGGRPILLAASTHSGEEEMVLDAYAQADPQGRAVLVIAPRHSERGIGIAALARSRGLATSLRSRGESLADRRVHVADTLGELGLWFRAASAAYIGGGLSRQIGGHNPLEAARLDCPVISGPEVRNWEEVYAALDEREGVTVIRTSNDLGQAFALALNDPALGRAQAARARTLIDGQAEALESGWAAIAALLPSTKEAQA